MVWSMWWGYLLKIEIRLFCTCKKFLHMHAVAANWLFIWEFRCSISALLA